MLVVNLFVKFVMSCANCYSLKIHFITQGSSRHSRSLESKDTSKDTFLIHFYQIFLNRFINGVLTDFYQIF